MPDGWLFGLAALIALLSAWLTVILLVHPLRSRGAGKSWSLGSLIGANSLPIADFCDNSLLSRLPSPRRFFEQLGPDRFRREFSLALKSRLDEHVDDVMSRRNEHAWLSLSSYARNRVYGHLHRRLPYAIDDFVDHVQQDLDEILSPSLLVRRHVQERPERLGALFLSAFGSDIRRLLPVAALVGGALGGWVLLGTGRWALPAGMAIAAFAGSALMLLALGWPRDPGGAWPLRVQGILYRRRERFVTALARQLANEALAWRSLVGEFLHGPHAGRSRQIMRREVSGILDVPLFKATLQWLLGPEGVYAVKSSALEKAMELLSSTPVSAALQEACRQELQRSLEHAAQGVTADDYAGMWRPMLRQAWRTLPWILAGVALGAGLLASGLATLA